MYVLVTGNQWNSELETCIVTSNRHVLVHLRPFFNLVTRVSLDGRVNGKTDSVNCFIKIQLKLKPAHNLNKSKGVAVSSSPWFSLVLAVSRLSNVAAEVCTRLGFRIHDGGQKWPSTAKTKFRAHIKNKPRRCHIATAYCALLSFLPCGFTLITPPCHRLLLAWPPLHFKSGLLTSVCSLLDPSVSCPPHVHRADLHLLSLWGQERCS